MLKFELKNFLNPAGRTNRTEFWCLTSFIAVFYGLMYLAEGGFGSAFFANIFLLLMAIPFCVSGVRRHHDIGKSGKGFVISVILIPLIAAGTVLITMASMVTNIAGISGDVMIVGAVIILGLLGLCCLKLVFALSRKGDIGHNQYGAAPEY